jgi:hypothetical protein
VTEREKLARIIDPEAFEMLNANMPADEQAFIRQLQNEALAKADQWLSRPSPVEDRAFRAGWHARVTGSGDVPGGLESALGYYMRGGTFGDDADGETEPRTAYDKAKGETQ